jgi:hypothetical protein
VLRLSKPLVERAGRFLDQHDSRSTSIRPRGVPCNERHPSSRWRQRRISSTCSSFGRARGTLTHTCWGGVPTPRRGSGGGLRG